MEKDSNAANTKLKLQNANGLLLTTVLSLKNFNQTVSFKLKPDDIVIGGFPKCGTTWTQYIVWDIVNEGAPLPNVNDIWYKEVPNLEMVGTDGLENMKSPRLFKISLPFNFTPYDPKAKYIYVLRNPWDCCISAFNHFKQVDEAFADCNFDDYFDCYVNGEISHGDYFDHLLSWYTHWDDPNFLFITYEDMKRDTRDAVLKIARFIGLKYYDLLNNDEKILQSIIQQTQFEHMKKNCSLERCSQSDNIKSDAEINFFRSGTVGQWKTFLTGDQKEKLKQKFIRKLSGTHLFFIWKKSDVFLD